MCPFLKEYLIQYFLSPDWYGSVGWASSPLLTKQSVTSSSFALVTKQNVTSSIPGQGTCAHAWVVGSVQEATDQFFPLTSMLLSLSLKNKFKIIFLDNCIKSGQLNFPTFYRGTQDFEWILSEFSFFILKYFTLSKFPFFLSLSHEK